jgi:ubiquinone/menaquinone biosynthesis C-methylase UbiE
MLASEDLKQIVRNRWSDPAHVTHYCREIARYFEGECPGTWCDCLAKALDGKKELKILDVGTGPGIFACLYARLGHHAWGLDFSTTMLERARRLAAEFNVECNFVLADAEDPPFPDDSFDAISSRSMIGMLPRPGLAIRRWMRILRPGGKLILIGNRPHPRSRHLIVRWARQFIGRRQHRFSGGEHAKTWESVRREFPLSAQTPAGVLAALMDAAGLDDVRLQPSDEIFPAAMRTFSALRRLTVPLTNPYILVGTKP